MSTSLFEIPNRRGTLPELLSKSTIPRDGRMRHKRNSTLCQATEESEENLDHLQRGARSISMTYTSPPGAIMIDMQKSSNLPIKPPTIKPRKQHKEPSMWELTEMISSLSKTKQLVVVNFEFNKYDVESRLEGPSQKIGSEDVSFEQTLEKYPRVKGYYEHKRNKSFLPEIHNSTRLHKNSEEDDEELQWKYYYPIMRYGYERPVVKKNNIKTQDKQQEKAQEKKKKKKKLQEKSSSVPKQRPNDSSLSILPSPSRRTLRRESASKLSINSTNDAKSRIKSEATQREEESKTFTLTAADAPAQRLITETKEDEEQQPELVELQRTESRSKKASEPRHERTFSPYEKVKMVQNDLIRKNNFSENYQKSLRTQFDRVLSYMNGKAHLNKKNITLVAALRKDVAAMPATYKIY